MIPYAVGVDIACRMKLSVLDVPVELLVEQRNRFEEALNGGTRFGVGVDTGFWICCVTESSVSFNDGYNSVLITEIDRCHGSGAFQAVLSQSRTQSEESLWDAKQSWLDRHDHGHGQSGSE